MHYARCPRHYHVLEYSTDYIATNFQCNFGQRVGCLFASKLNHFYIMHICTPTLPHNVTCVPAPEAKKPGNQPQKLAEGKPYTNFLRIFDKKKIAAMQRSQRRLTMPDMNRSFQRNPATTPDMLGITRIVSSLGGVLVRNYRTRWR